MRILVIVLSVWGWISAATAQESTDIEDVIGQQLEAFNARNVDDAWQFASPLIKQMFGNPQNFGAMVERGYPMVWTNTVSDFLDRRDLNGMTIQRVLIRDVQGVPHILEYAMIETPEGWRINGVAVLPARDVGA